MYGFGSAPFGGEEEAPSGGGGFTLLPALGLLVLTGFAPSFPTTVTPGLGQITLTGQAPTFPRTVVSGLAQITLDGYAPTITVATPGFTLQPGFGQLNVTGFAPTLGLPRTIVSGVGALDLTGFAPKFPRTIVTANPGGSTTYDETFTDTNGTGLIAHTPTGVNPGVSWDAEVTTGSDLVVAANRIRGVSGGYANRRDSLNKGSAYPADYTVEADYVFKTALSDDYVTIGIRWDGSAGYDLTYQSFDGTFNLKAGGTSLGVYAFAYPAVDTVVAVKLVGAGTSISVEINGVQQIAVTDSTYTGAGKPTIRHVGGNGVGDTTSIHIDNFRVSFGGGASLELVGFAPSISTVAAGYTLNAGFGQLDLTGFSPQFARTIVPSTGLLNLTGFAPAIGLPQTLRPGFGGLTLSGFAPSLSFVFGGFNLQPGLGALSLAGFAPSIGLPRTLVPGTGLLDLTGYAPRFPLTIKPQTGLLSLTGFGPSITFTPVGLFILPGTGQLVLTGYAPQFGTWTFRFAGGSVMTATMTAGGVLVASITGGPTFTGGMSGGPV